MAGILDSITQISAIVQEQGCDWAEARRLWEISKELEAENARPKMIFTQDPLDIADRMAAQMGVDVEEALNQMQACDFEAVRQFHVGNRMPKIMVN